MAPEWEAMMGLDLGMGVHHHRSTTMPPAPSHFYGGDLSFFPPADAAPAAAGGPPPASGSFNLSFADDFSIPMMQSEEAAELEWLSHFIDDSYYPDNYQPEVAAAAQQRKPSSAAAGARTKRSGRATSSPSSSWSSTSQQKVSRSSSANNKQNQAPAAVGGRGDGTTSNDTDNEEGGVRRCTHCASEKTPQWRTGPLGPKTLCNACGVRYKSGRLVPEYRPAASPTFVLTQHSNSHRKVMELRQQKELLHLRGGAASAAAFRDRDYGGVC